MLPFPISAKKKKSQKRVMRFGTVTHNEISVPHSNRSALRYVSRIMRFWKPLPVAFTLKGLVRTSLQEEQMSLHTSAVLWNSFSCLNQSRQAYTCDVVCVGERHAAAEKKNSETMKETVRSVDRRTAWFPHRLVSHEELRGFLTR